ncbi:hypothetical protein EAD89_16440 [Micromonospora sp. BL4]|uniref:phospholipase D family protein n=1 Tax=Micromonospora sp. BL4 TaxID=2478710 RepID=UPI000F2B48AF|nr:phospholipase D family protein [Micromonospora sp. BL4]RLP88626.1 hypothetical protein EAD89_16440 [Micromonospora sp. BL4]
MGTTYTLNLTTLLMVPAAHALLDAGQSGDSEDEAPEGLTPIGLLDALHRTADRITLFCDAAQIAPPLHRRRALLGFIEQAVVPVTAPRGGAFHPKLWALRHVDEAGRPTFRLLVATRNLTFDRCWDTITVLESDPGGQRLAGIGDLVRGLPALSVTSLPDARHKPIAALADELDAVRFAPPEGFRNLRLHVFGLDEGPWPFPKSCHRLLVVSPFLSSTTLQRLPTATTRRALMSRPEALSAAGQAASTYECFTLNSAVLDDAPDVPRASRDDPRRVQDGLHAKLYVTDDATGTSWWTGSANATGAAFERNVEVLLQLDTTAERHSVRALLQQRREGDPERRTFRDLLLSWEAEDGHEPADDNRDELDEVRRAVTAIPFTATVAESEPGRYEVTYRSDKPLPLPAGVEVRCRPATVAQLDQPSVFDTEGRLVFCTSATLTNLSAFLVIELTLAGLSTVFVVRCTLHGEPEDRRQRLIADLVGDAHRLVRYLLALLADDELPLNGEEVDRVGAYDWTGADLERLPLTEVMLRALAKDPGRLREVADLLKTVRDGGGQLPDGLDGLWDAVWHVAQEDIHG